MNLESTNDQKNVLPHSVKPMVPESVILSEDSSLKGASEWVVENHEVPMVVWLRGDEDYCEDYCVDADEAMNLLGIKRSRLTQLSGKEIRVGRRRVGRYVKPFYRQEDIDSYLKWTRSSATSSKSKAALLEAEEILTQSVQKMQESVVEQIDDLRKIFDQKLGQRMSEASQINQNLLNAHLSKNMQAYQNILIAVEKSTRGLFSQIPSGEVIQKIVRSNVQNIQNTHQALQGVLEQLNQSFSELRATQSLQSEETQKIKTSLSELNESSVFKQKPSKFVFRPRLTRGLPKS